MRPFLKWPGGKYRLLEQIHSWLPSGKELVEPFVGSGAVFLNTTFEHCLLNDANPDLITLYRVLQQEGHSFIEICRSFFTKKLNSKESYYRLRARFNACRDPIERSALFLYLNRHGYNGLCRYNAQKNEFNVPFGQYVKPYFPEKEMVYFYEKAKRVTFVCEDFAKTMQRAKKGSVIYCDPPYVPLNSTACFTAYRGSGFSLTEQEKLALLAKKLSAKGIPVLLSNHSNHFTNSVYQGALIKKFMVQRFISCRAVNRTSVQELLAFYPAL
jgi:DNA adenine methylase